jgi:hypothetical protein
LSPSDLNIYRGDINMGYSDKFFKDVLVVGSVRPSDRKSGAPGGRAAKQEVRAGLEDYHARIVAQNDYDNECKELEQEEARFLAGFKR